MDVQTKWLIRSSGVIKGPYLKIEIEELLSSRELVVIDEVCEPMGFWRPIRDKNEFAKIVEILRIKTIEAHEGGAEFGLDDSMTMNLGDDEDLVVEEDTSTEYHKDFNEKVKAYGTKPSEEAILGAKKSGLNLWRTLVLLLILGGTGVFVKINYLDKEKQIISAEKYIELANRQLRLGLYNQALGNYKEAYEIDQGNLSIHLYLGSLLIQVDQSYLLGRRLLKNIITQHGPYIKLAETGVGLSYLQESEFKLAEKHFQNSLSIDRTYTPAYVNIGVIKLLEEKHREAIEYLKAAVEDGEKDAAARLLLSMAYLKKWEVDPQLFYLVEAQKSILKNTEIHAAYYQESLLIQTYIESILGDRDVKNLELEKILNVNPDLTLAHRKNIFIDRSLLDWEAFYDWCKTLSQRGRGNYHRALLGYCELRSGDFRKGLSQLERSTLKDPNNPLFLALYSYGLYKSGRQSEAKVALSRAEKTEDGKKLENNSFSNLKYIMKLKFCESQKNTDCMQANWATIYKNDQQSLEAITGLAQSYLKSGDRNQAFMYYKKALKISKDYMPLLKTAMEIQ